MRHHTGSGRRRVIHPDWETHHATVVEGTLTGTVALRVPGLQTVWNEETERTERIPNDPYATVSCRVLALDGEARRIVSAAGDDEVVADYLLVVPRHVDGAVAGHLGYLADTGDPDLDGRTLLVHRAVLGTERFERDLFCTLTD